MPQISNGHDFPQIQNTIESLDEGIRKYHRIGMQSLYIVGAISVVLGYFVFDLFRGIIQDIGILPDEGNTWLTFIIVLVLRTSLLGSFIIAFLIYAFKFTSSSFDQAVRFAKRKHATLFLLDILTHVKPERDNIKQIMEAFREWNVSVESAYTELRFDTKLSKQMMERMSKTDEAIVKYIRDTARRENETAGSAGR